MDLRIFRVFVAVVIGAVPFWAPGQEIFHKDFTTADGHSDGVAISGVDNWTAQGSWVAAETAGQGYATSAGDWQRAKTYHDVAPDLEVDESVEIEVLWRGQGLVTSGGTNPVEVFGIGISDSVLHAGNGIPAVPCKVMVGDDDTLRFGSDSTYVPVPLADAYTNPQTDTHSHWFRIAMRLTRLSTADTFAIRVEVHDEETGQARGVVNFNVADQATYLAPALNVAMRTYGLSSSGFSASQVDELTVSRVATAVPATVSLDLTRQLFIGGVSELNRKQFINWHAQAKPNEYNAAEANRMFVDLEANVGRNIGAFNWIRDQVPDEDPPGSGYVHVANLEAWCLANQDGHLNNWSRVLYPNGEREEFVWCSHLNGIPHERWVDETGFVAINNDAAAEWYSTVFQNYWSANERPAFLEPVNEPWVHMNEIIVPGTGMAIDEQGVIDFQAAVIDRIHAEVPGVQAGGPCSAWPEFALWGYGHWNDRMKNFIDDVGDRADFISWHIYSTIGDSGSLTPDRMGSNVDYLIDLVENYSHNVHGAPLPMLFSEFGGGFSSGSAWRDTYTPLRDWLVLRSCLGKTLQFMQRPDRIVKAVAFVTGKATWYSGPSSYPWVCWRRPDGTGGSLPYEESHLTKYFEYFKGLRGNQFPVTTSDPDLLGLAFVDGPSVSLLLGSIDVSEPFAVDVQALLEPGASVSSATLTRIYWDGAQPVLLADVPTASWQTITLQPEEYVVLKLTLSQQPKRFDQLHRRVHYGDRTVVAYNGAAESFALDTDLDPERVTEAVLRVGVTRPHGQNPVPTVVFNSQSLATPTDWAGADQAMRNEFSGAIPFAVPVGLVQANNTVQVSFDSNVADDYISSVVLEAGETFSVEEIVVQSTATPSGSQMQFTFPTLPGVEYRLQKSTDLAVWNDVGPAVTGDGTIRQLVGEVDDLYAFFRVAATPL